MENRVLTIGELVSYLRRQAGLTQLQLAKKSRLSRTTIMYIESGRCIPYDRTLQKIIASYPSWGNTINQYDAILRSQKKTRQTT